MALKDFRDSNKSITIMRKGEDSSYTFQLVEPDGSTFIPQNYTLVSEARFCEASETPDLTFPVSAYVSSTDGLRYCTITFPRSVIVESIRDSKIYWRIFGTNSVTTLTRLIGYGEIWLM